MPNQQENPDSTLTTFGGLVTELNPADLPAGSSPLCCDCDFTIGSVKTRLGLSSVYASIGALNFNYVKSFEPSNGSVTTLALDSSGTFWSENVLTSEGTLTEFFSLVSPNSFAKSVTFDDREFIAISNLQQGTAIPRQYSIDADGTIDFDRVSQVGPGAGCQVGSISTSYTITSISQIGTQTLGVGGNNWDVLWSSGPSQNTPGNIITFYGPNEWIGAGPTGFLQPGDNIVIAGVQTMNGFNPNNNSGGSPNPVYYTVTSVGVAQTLGGTTHPIFTIQVNQIGFYSAHTAVSTYEPTLGTLVTILPIPNTQVGSQLTISGASPAGWDGTYPVLYTPNGAQMAINTTSLTSGVGTYAFTLISGTTPSVGQLVTVAGTSNGNGIFNVTGARISATGSGTFSVLFYGKPNIASAAETGTAIVNATIFQIDPQAVVATSTAGSVVVAGNLGAGTRGAVVMFLTQNGALTQPSPQVIFTLSASASSITCSQIPIGPPNTIARVIAFTGAGGATLAGGGGFYYWIPTSVSVISNNQVVIYTPTIINDNTTMSATFTFTDAVLLAASSISFQGSNNFAQIELGSSAGFIAYSQRLFAWGEQNKIQNLLNPTFDGGIGYIIPNDTNTVTSTYPLGWAPDANYGGGTAGGGTSSVVVSPIFGNSYYIQNTLNVAGTYQGMIEQSAYQDSFAANAPAQAPGHRQGAFNSKSGASASGGAPIIQPNTLYSIRITCSCPSGITNLLNDLFVDLTSPSLGLTYGKARVNLKSMSTTLQIFTLPLLTTPFTTVPKDLLIRLYGYALSAGSDILVDRIEVFPTNQPVLTTQLRASYFNNFEAFDGVTGNLGVGAQNQQPVSTAFTLFDNLYIVRERSFCSTSDNGITEPNGWSIKEIAGIGTPSINGVDYSTDKNSESWAIIAGQAGLYLFDGGQPQKISSEIDTLWQTINWTYGYTLWVKADIINRRIYIGVPLPTPNQWMPDFPANANPTQPNVVLMLNYRELLTGGAIQNEGAVRQSFMGELRTFQLGRKWSAWSIQASYADFVTRADTTQPLFFCNDQLRGKIYQQLTSANYLDDGALIPWDYITSPMPKTQEAQQLGMGNHMLEAHMSTALLVGGGNCQINLYPDTITSPYAENVGVFPMSNPPAYGDTEIIINNSGSRFFLEFANGGTTAAPANFELSRVVLTVEKSAYAPLRGSN